MKQCSILSCDRPFLAKKLCNLHYYRVKRGLPLLEPTRFTRRPAIIDEDIARIELGNRRGYTIVDIEFAHISKHNWSLDGHGYPCTWMNGKIMKIHHMIIGRPDEGLVVDHINRDRLDNRLANLRFVTQGENVRNSNNPIIKAWKN